MRKAMALCLICQMTLSPVVGWCQSVPDLAGTVHVLPQVDVNGLPVYLGVASGLIEFENPDGNTLIVHQDKAEGASTAKAVIDWQSFNIGEKAATHFDQKGYADWAILNRIHDRSPSQILGQLSADGRIYLVNRNGILFGPGSQVNVHSLTASTLNLSNENFQQNALNFKYEDYQTPDGETLVPDMQIGVINQGNIVARENGGKIFLLGQRVSNEGLISAPAGQVGLAAGAEISIRQPETGDVQRIPLGSYVDIKNDPGTVENSTSGAILSDLGLVGLYGREVIQEGVVRATTSPEKTSQIELLATDRIALGSGSWTATPISVSDKTYVGEKEPARIVLRGITTGDTATDTVATVKRVEHSGVIDAPSGEVTIRADERVYLESGSKIDVSGLWSDRTMGGDVLESYLNSIELRDDFGQKTGILKGERIQYLANQGTAIGDVSASVGSREVTAAEQNVTGGTINIEVGINDPVGTTRDIIVRDGAELNFSGGGFTYGQGVRETTKLLSGDRIYSISDAPQWLTYDNILGRETVVHKKFGVVEEFQGMYYGGAVSLLDYGAKYVEGADAGTLSLVAPRILLDGNLKGSAQVGIYQVFTDAEEVPEGIYGVLKPKSGTLKLGREPAANASPELKDAVLERAQVVGSTQPLRELAAGDELSPEQANIFSADKLIKSGVGQLEIHANTELTIAADATLRLQSGGSFDASARRIIQEGSIVVPAGQVTMTLGDNLSSFTQLPGSGDNPRYAELEGRYFLGADGAIDVSGETVDNRFATGGAPLQQGMRHGGAIEIHDQSTAVNDLILKQGSRIDVSGGYEIGTDGSVRGGNAGSLSLRADNLVFDGELVGKALLGKNGGTLALHASEVEIAGTPQAPLGDIAAQDVLPAGRQGLTLAAEEIADTGFTNLDFKSVNDLTLRSGVVLQPSFTRLAPAKGFPDRKPDSGEVRLSSEGLPLPADIGKTSISLAAGAGFPNLVPAVEPNLEARTLIEAGAGVSVAPTGKIVVKGPQVEVDGLLQARAGQVQVAASVGDLKLGPAAKILATGWNQPEPPSADTGISPAHTPLDGGTIALSAQNGNLLVAEGALVDVSAAPLTQVHLRDAFNKIQAVETAGNPGRVSITAFGENGLAGTISGQARLKSGRGGSFELVNSNLQRSVELTDADFTRISADGFDAVELRSAGGFELAGSIDAEFGRSLTLDSPQFSTDGAADVQFTAPWLRLINTSGPQTGNLLDGEGKFRLYGEWVDVVGDVRLDGFGEVFINARRDLRLSDYDYSRSAATTYSGWAGELSVPGELTLKASRIFPQVPDDFAREFAKNFSDEFSPAFSADYTFSAGGKITTLAGDLPLTGEVASAGGSLNLKAGGGIEHRGNLEAPQGTITLQATGTGEGGRVLLADGSRLSTAGSGSTQYGSVKNEVWFATDKSEGNRQRGEITGGPEKTVAIEGSEVLLADGSLVDVSGGGSVFGYQFEPGVDGSVNPLQGRLVVVRDPEVKLPGEAIYLKGGGGLEEGIYSILPEQYAFREDAYVLTDLGTAYVAGTSQVTEQGYRIVGGYQTEQGTQISAPVLNSYALRKASEVFREGQFAVVKGIAGEGGNVSLLAPTTVVNGTLKATPLQGFSGGRVAMSGENVYVRQSETPLPSGFDFATGIPAELLGTLNLDGSGVSGQGFAEVALGDLTITRNVTLEEGSRLEAEKIFLAGSEHILLKSGARIDALSERGAGEVSLHSPAGRVTLEEGAVVHAADGLTLATNDLSLQGDFEIDNSFLKLLGDKIIFLPDETRSAEAGLFITQKFWSLFQDFEHVGLQSASDIIFRGNFSLAVADSLTLDANRIAAENGSVDLTAGYISLANSSGTSFSDRSLSDNSLLSLRAQTIEIGPGTVATDGFAEVAMVATNDVILKGQGALASDGDIAITAGRVTVTGSRGNDDVYQAGDFIIDAGNAGVTIAGTGSGTTPVEAGAAGGRLSIAAGTIRHSGVIDNTAGTTVFTAVDSIHVDAGGQILSRGNDQFGAGTVDLRAQSGGIELAPDSLIDVSAGGQGDAGRILLSGAAQGVAVHGELKGDQGSSAGRGGSFNLDSATVGDFSALNQKLTVGGFDERIAVRSRNGDLVLNDTLKARDLYVAADNGQLTVAGVVDASGNTEGGRIELHAGQDLVLAMNSRIEASGALQGGSVVLNSRDGHLRQESGAAIDVTGAQGGNVHLRADRETATSGIKMDLQGRITGASEVVAEAVQNYATAGGTLALTTALNEATSYMSNALAIEGGLLAGLSPDGPDFGQMHLRPGIEVESAGDLTIAATSLSGARYADEPGLLTVRTQGNLTVSGKLSDAPTSLNALNSSSAKDSWGITLVSGADGGAADPTSTRSNQGDLKVNDNAQVYTEKGSVTLAAGNNIDIGKSTSGPMVSSQIPLTVGSYAGEVSVRSGKSLTLNGGVIQTATGDLSVSAGTDVNLNTSGGMGTIRTLGETQAGSSDYWTFANGGDIDLRAGGSLNGNLNAGAWDFAHGRRPPKQWGASFNGASTTQGLATLGGGDLTVDVAGNYAVQTGTFGSGDLKIAAGGNLSGRFLNRQGEATVAALGNVGSAANRQVFEMFDTALDVSAQGDVQVAAVVNPTIAREEFNPRIASSVWSLGYTPESRVSLTSVSGDVVMAGNSPFYNDTLVNAQREAVLPASVAITAGRDIRLMNTFAMLPAAEGNLKLIAGQDIDGGYLNASNLQQVSRIIMNDGNPSDIYGSNGVVPSDLFAIDPEVRSSLLHRGDTVPIVISAGENVETGGDIVNIGLRLPKMALITAGGDIRFIRYVGQNTDTDNVSVIRAEDDIIVESSLDAVNNFGIEHGGPGSLLVQAGNRLDLGTSEGIRTYGSEKNVSLGAKGSDLIVVAGYQKYLSMEQLAAFFSQLKVYGEDYSQALAAGNTSEAQGLVDEVRELLIHPTLGPAPTASERISGKGDIDMVESLIRTSGGADNIYIIAGGDANVGRSSIGAAEENSDTGIATTAGGDISIYLTGDLNVNESRVMTFGGGDILAWSDQGNINAGRGSRTAISRPPLKIQEDPVTHELSLIFSPPAVGSGVRALTYDPDGVAGPKEAPPIGDIYLIAPSGVIDAGEAGIAGGRVILGATEVLNGQNVSFSFGSVGVPAASDSAGSLGGLSGMSSMNEASSLMEQVSGFGPREEMSPTQVVDSFIEKWIDVEVIGFDI